MNLLRTTAIALSIALISGCGVTYTSPRVSTEDTAYDVEVVALTPDVVSRANESSYVPKRLPRAFSQTAGQGGRFQGIGSIPDAPEVPTRPEPGSLTLSLPPEVEPQTYTIGVGDVVLFATRASGTLPIDSATGLATAQSQRQSFTVRDDGAIAIPEVGVIPFEGLTLEAAEDRLFQRLVQNQLDSEFSLEIAEFNSKRVSIGGAVKSSALVPITLNPLRLDEAITTAGGITLESQDFGSIRIYRDGSLYQIPLEAYFTRPNVRKIMLIDGDSVYVDGTYDLTKAQEYYSQQIEAIGLRQAARNAALAELGTEINLRRTELAEQRTNFEARLEAGAVDRDYVYLAGEVSQQARVPLPFETKASLADVMFEGGGLPTSTGNPAQIYVLRQGSGSGITAYHLDARNVVNLTVATKFEMRPDDIVFVQEQPITVWGRALAQAFPALINVTAASVSE